MNNIFHNSIGLDGDALKSAVKKSARQEEIIYEFFCRQPDKEFTPFEVMRLCNINAPLTSIRRAITNLTHAKKLVKTQTKKQGQYGMPNYCWKLADKQLTIF